MNPKRDVYLLEMHIPTASHEMLFTLYHCRHTTAGYGRAVFLCSINLFTCIMTSVCCGGQMASCDQACELLTDLHAGTSACHAGRC